MTLDEVRKRYKSRFGSHYCGLYVGSGICLLILADIVDHRNLILDFISLVEEILVRLTKLVL